MLLQANRPIITCLCGSFLEDSMCLSAYIHIPFCSYKCDFCDFVAFANLDHLSHEYCLVVAQEIKARQKLEPNKESLATIFYGGGTPGLVDPDDLALIHRALDKEIGIESNAEINLETTPHSITQEKLEAWHRLGINRISIGVQSFIDEELTTMGRDHSASQAVEAINLAAEQGFKSLSIDLMYGLPGQTKESFNESLDIALSLPIQHLSSYGLTLAKQSPLALRLPESGGHYPQEEEFASMYRLLVEKTQARGLRRYEISNFALAGHESKHNQRYWNNEEYLAFGVGAHRYFNGIRSANLRSLKKYMANALGLDLEEPIDASTKLKEAIFLGLRKSEGLDVLDFRHRFDLDLYEAYKDQIARHVKGGFLEDDGRFIKLTLEGVLVSNSVMADFM